MKRRSVVSALPQFPMRNQKTYHLTSIAGLVLYAIAFLLCILLSIAPLSRLAGTMEFSGLRSNALLIAIGSWLPHSFRLSKNTQASLMATQVILFLALVAVEFLLYGLSVRWIQRSLSASNYRRIIQIIWLTTIVGGLFFVFTPAMISHDVYVYAGYGRLLVVHHANPYFVTLTAYPHDPFIRLDDWKNALAAYGPVWLIISAVSARIAGTHPLQYVLLYRLLDLAAHLFNTYLVSTILRRLGHTTRVVVTGMLLYAWNPLVLQESCLGGHMDVCMVTLILIGILFCVRAEQRDEQQITTLRGYLPALIAFTLATLIKFTGAPLIAFFLVLLARKSLQPPHMHLSLRQFRQLQWWPAIRTVIPALLISAGLMLTFYVPFWLGHSVAKIIASFTSPPSASLSYGSILDAFWKWDNLHHVSKQHSLLSFILYEFGQHRLWQYINIAVTVTFSAVGAIWLWRKPTTRTLTLATLLILSALLIVTPWFFPWYVIWIVGLAVVCLPIMQDRVGRALVALALVFSASAHFIYLFARGYQVLGSWMGWTFITTVGPPLLAVLLCLVWHDKKRSGQGAVKD